MKEKINRRIKTLIINPLFELILLWDSCSSFLPFEIFTYASSVYLSILSIIVSYNLTIVPTL